MTTRVLVIGNCQARIIAEIMTRSIPGISVETFQLRYRPRGREEIAGRLSEFDLVFAQPVDADRGGPLAFAELQERRDAHIIWFPIIAFYGFHPDFLLARELGDARSAALTYHSRIVAAAYANGVPANEVGRLFNPLTFAQLGYFREYENSKAFLVSKAREIGYDLEPELREWSASGVFMHTPNHPALRVLVCIARRAAERAGLSLTTLPEMNDHLADAVRLPIFPAIARRLKVEPQSLFTVKDKSFGLPRYVVTTYEMYRSAPASFFDAPAIQRVAEALFYPVPALP